MFTPLMTGMAVHEAAFISACVVVFCGAITMEQVYREIDWRVVFLLALIIPLGQAVGDVAAGEQAAKALADVAVATPEVFLLLGFVIAGSDGKFMEAKAEVINGTSVAVWSDRIADPVMVRYAWSQRAICNLYTESGLPVGPFRTDEGRIPPAEIRD